MSTIYSSHIHNVIIVNIFIFQYNFQNDRYSSTLALIHCFQRIFRSFKPNFYLLAYTLSGITFLFYTLSIYVKIKCDIMEQILIFKDGNFYVDLKAWMKHLEIAPL